MKCEVSKNYELRHRYVIIITSPNISLTTEKTTFIGVNKRSAAAIASIVSLLSLNHHHILFVIRNDKCNKNNEIQKNKTEGQSQIAVKTTLDLCIFKQ